METQGGVLREVLEALDDLGIPYMVAGSFASGFHGVFRATQDADLVIDPDSDQLDRLLERLEQAFYVSREAAAAALARRGQFNLVHFETAWKVDLIIRKDRPFSRVEFERAELGSLARRSVRINSPEDVILSKLEWAKLSGSRRQLEDAAGVVAVRREALDWTYLEHWAEELSVTDLLAQIRCTGDD